MVRAIDNGTGNGINRTAVLGGAALMGVGVALSSVGAILWCVAAAGAVRQWVRGREEPPTQTARRMVTQAGAATQAGIEGWRKARVPQA